MKKTDAENLLSGLPQNSQAMEIQILYKGQSEYITSRTFSSGKISYDDQLMRIVMQAYNMRPRAASNEWDAEIQIHISEITMITLDLIEGRDRRTLILVRTTA